LFCIDCVGVERRHFLRRNIGRFHFVAICVLVWAFATESGACRLDCTMSTLVLGQLSAIALVPHAWLVSSETSCVGCLVKLILITFMVYVCSFSLEKVVLSISWLMLYVASALVIEAIVAVDWRTDPFSGVTAS